MNRYFFLAAFMVLGAGSAKKKDSSHPKAHLPPTAPTGPNSFGCVVDGKLFKPKKKDWFSFRNSPMQLSVF